MGAAMHRLIDRLIIAILLMTGLPGQIAPVENLHEFPPRVWALTHGKVYFEPGVVLEDATILIRFGTIDTVGQNLPLPPDATEIDLKGKSVYPGFIDGWWEIATNDTNRSPADHWNPKVHANLNVFDYYKPAEKDLYDFRKVGFTNAQIIPKEGIFRGQSALVQLGDEPQALEASVAQVVDFQYGGWGSKEYPNSLLGCIALIRQTLLDADWYRKARKIFAENPEGNEPVPVDHSLETLATAHQEYRPFLFNTRDELYALRAGAIAREFGLNLWLKGNGYEYRRLEDIAALKPFLILPVNYPAKPDVTQPYQALQYSLEQLKHWDLAPDNAAKLVAANLSVAFTSSGLKKRADFRKQLARSVVRGLPREAALAALTTIPARRMGAGDYLGKVAPGYLANLVIVEGDYFNPEDPIRAVWIGGTEYRVEPAERVDPAGSWSLVLRDNTWSLKLDRKKSKWSGTLSRDTLAFDLKSVQVDDDRLSWTLTADTLDFSGVTRFAGHFENQNAAGQAFFADGTIAPWQATRTEPAPETKPDTLEAEAPSDLTVFYPEGAFGLEAPPEQPYAIMVDDATIWTCGPQGVLKNWDILFVAGKVDRIAPDISIPRGSALVIDGRGKHVTPGLIDCHSHTATSSVNEGTQSVTAEVRIRDVLNSDDISIYRELAGGLTIAHVLHGSANTIGGQNAVIKLRWGSPPDKLLYRRAPQTLKIALGENVKQSNWGDKFTTRYPQTRMGVEQVLRDAFTAARDYRQRWETYRRDVGLQRTKIPPRKDLELEALVEILEGKRFVHAHSYRQDEILMLTRVAEDFGFTVGAFQHVLEGYKVANRIAEHGAGASTFSDWWAYKFEVIDAIPYNATLMTRVGVVTSLNSDSNELARRLNTEAAKAVKYGGLSEEEALKLVTINPARQLKIDRWVGSLEVGKDADFVIWSDHPLSTRAVCEQTWIDGRLYFSRERDQELRARDQQLRNQLIQKILQTKKTGGEPMTPAAESRSYPYSCLLEFSDELEEGGGR
jgi:imidazolonepropionase-like amidohydrolase